MRERERERERGGGEGSLGRKREPPKKPDNEMSLPNHRSTTKENKHGGLLMEEQSVSICQGDDGSMTGKKNKLLYRRLYLIYMHTSRCTDSRG